MMYLGDFIADQAIYFMWNTMDSTGASITRSGDGVLSVYKDNSDGSSFDQTQVTTGITNDEDVDGITGVHSCCITTTNAWYETGHDYVVVLSGSTIDGESVNAVIAHFSIENRNMRGTDSAALAATALSTATWTNAKAVHLDADISSRNATTPPTVGAIRTEMEGVGTKITEILEDTGTTLDAMIGRILGMEQENFFIDNTTYSGVHLTGARIRIYSVAGSVGTASDVIATYTMTASYTGDEMDDYKVVKL